MTSETFKKEIGLPFLYVLVAVDFIWLRSAYGKISGGKFITSLDSTLQKFASSNPYPPVKDFLQNIAMPNSITLGYLIMWGEVLVAVALAVGVLLLMLGKLSKFSIFILALGLLGGSFLNLTFWLASGWTGASTDGLNLLMFVIEIVGFTQIVKLLRKE